MRAIYVVDEYSEKKPMGGNEALMFINTRAAADCCLYPDE